MFVVSAWKYRNITGFIEESVEKYELALALMRAEGIDDRNRQVTLALVPFVPVPLTLLRIRMQTYDDSEHSLLSIYHFIGDWEHAKLLMGMAVSQA